MVAVANVVVVAVVAAMAAATAAGRITIDVAARREGGAAGCRLPTAGTMVVSGCYGRNS